MIQSSLPNVLLCIRIALSFLLAILLHRSGVFITIVCVLMFAFAAFTDYLDGFLARKLDAESLFGKVVDPIADKILVSCCLISLVDIAILEYWIAMLIIVRELVVSGVREYSVKVGMVDIPVIPLSKTKTGFQMVAIGFLIGSRDDLGVPYVHEVGIILIYIALILTVYTGFLHCRTLYLGSKNSNNKQ